MTQPSSDFMAQAAEQFQQALTQSFAKALESFKGLDAGVAGAGFPAMGEAVPDIKFSQDRLQALQKSYVEEAIKLFSQGMGHTPPLYLKAGDGVSRGGRGLGQQRQRVVDSPV